MISIHFYNQTYCLIQKSGQIILISLSGEPGMDPILLSYKMSYVFYHILIKYILNVNNFSFFALLLSCLAIFNKLCKFKYVCQTFQTI